MPYKKGLKFKPHFKTALYSGYFILPGKLRVHFGMQLANGVVLTNGEPIDVTINEGSVSSDESASTEEGAISSDEAVIDETVSTESEI